MRQFGRDALNTWTGFLPKQALIMRRSVESRLTAVVGEGNPHARLVFIGESPNEHEDEQEAAQRRPFGGQAGQLLDKMIEAMGYSPADVYIANIVKCRAPGDRDLKSDEAQACLDAIQPKVVVALGELAAQNLLSTEEPFSNLRGKFHPYRGAMLMPTFHPAFLLRNLESKREAWADLKMVKSELEKG